MATYEAVELLEFVFAEVTIEQMRAAIKELEKADNEE